MHMLREDKYFYLTMKNVPCSGKEVKKKKLVIAY